MDVKAIFATAFHHVRVGTHRGSLWGLGIPGELVEISQENGTA